MFVLSSDVNAVLQLGSREPPPNKTRLSQLSQFPQDPAALCTTRTMADKCSIAKKEIKLIAKSYHEAQGKKAYTSELLGRIDAADRVIQDCGTIDNGHLAAINVALHNATGGKLGDSVDEAKQFVDNGRYLDRRNATHEPFAFDDIKDQLIMQEAQQFRDSDGS